MPKRVVMLTGTALRHDFARKALAREAGIDLVLTVCEGHAQKQRRNAEGRGLTEESLAIRHLDMRDRAERDFFGAFDRYVPDQSNPLFAGDRSVNAPDIVDRILAAEPDVVVAYGCSIVREPLLSAFAGRFLNVHLGLSPYFRGAGTNFFCFVEGLPECCGATFMYIDAGIDTGAILHQIRPAMTPEDSIHTIGNRLIVEMIPVYAALVRHLDGLEALPQPAADHERVYRQRDFTDEATVRLYENFASGMIPRYLAEKQARDAAFPIVEQAAVVVDAVPVASAEGEASG